MERIRQERKKGWKKPDNTVSVSRPSQWGNPFKVGEDGTQEECVEKYRKYILENPILLQKTKELLKGKNLMCYCKLDTPCHADVLLEIANE
jgi:hypothetical protein